MTYTSHADLGGTPGHGRVVPEPEGELWHAPWEPGVLALTLAMGATGAWNIDLSRAARETLPAYARLTYYEIWFEGLLKLLAERGLVGDDELAAGHSLRPPQPLRKAKLRRRKAPRPPRVKSRPLALNSPLRSSLGPSASKCRLWRK